MSQLTKKYLPTLKRIRKMGDGAKQEYVRKCDKQFPGGISECAKNVTKGNASLTPRQMTNLRRKKNDLRALSKRKTSLRIKRKILQKVDFSAPYYRRSCPYWVACSYRTDAGDQEVGSGRRIR